MSADLFHAVLHRSPVRGAPSRLVLLILADAADWRGRVTIGQEEIARRSRLTRAAVSNALGKLERAEAIEVVAYGTGNVASTYAVAMPQPLSPAVSAEGEDETTDDAESDPAVGDGEFSLVVEAVPPAESEPEGYGFVCDPGPAPVITAPAPGTASHLAAQHPAFKARPALPVAPGHPVNDVGRLLTALGVPPDGKEPLYWHRRSHLADLDALLQRAGLTDLSALVNALRGQRLPDPLNRLTQLEPT